MFFAPVAYEHAARLIGKSPWDVSRDPELLYQAHKEAYLTYRHSPVVPVIDIYNIEAEGYGAIVEKPHGNSLPAIREPVLNSVSDVIKLKRPSPAPDRTIMAVDVADRLRGEFPEIDIRIPLSGPFSIAANLLGYEKIITELVADEPAVVSALEKLVEDQLQTASYVAERNFAVTLFETGASPPMLSPSMFKSALLHPLKVLVGRIADLQSSPPSLIIGGDTVKILDYILETGTKFIICPAETNQAEFLAGIYEKSDAVVRVNMSPSILVSDSWDDIRSEVDRILGLIHGIDNACIGTGPLPYETDPGTVLKIRDYIETRMG